MRTAKILKALGTCGAEQLWAEAHPDPREAWQSCEEPGWLMWLVEQLLPRERRVWVGCQIARPLVASLPPSELRPLIAIETAERWTRGEVTAAQAATAAMGAYKAYEGYCALFHASASVSARIAADQAADIAFLAWKLAELTPTTFFHPRQECCEIIRREIAWEEIEAALTARGLLG